MADSPERVNAALAGRYVIDRELGAGGMARVYLGRDLKHGRQVALKVLRPEFSTPAGRERFLREIHLVAQLTHPNILPLHDSGVADDFCYFVMPYVEGETLRDRLDREGQMAIDDALAIGREIAEALGFAHTRGVIHRDIKPQNVMLLANHAVVMDFGIAIAIDAVTQERLTSTGLVPGTARYMSPEQAGGVRRLDGRSDVYSLGCVLYEMLAGDPPFTGSTPQAVMSRKSVEPVPSLRVVRATVDEDVERVVLRSLAIVPADRYALATEFARALAEAERARVRSGGSHPATGAVSQVVPPTEAADATAQPRAPRPASPLSTARRLGISAIVATAVLLLLTIIGFLSTKAFDIKLGVPAQYTPTRSDFVVVGAQALFPVLLDCCIAAIAGLLVWYVVRAARAVLRHLLPHIAAQITRAVRQRAERLSQWGASIDPGIIADLYFAGAIVLSGLVLTLFWSMLVPLFTADTEVLACGHRALHRSFAITLELLIGVVCAGWLGVFRPLHRPEGARRYALAQWGSAVLILLLLLALTTPWRVLWEAGKERVLVDGARGYLLKETNSEFVVYDPVRRSTFVLPRERAASLQHKHIAGYPFEEPGVFDSGQLECLSVTRPEPSGGGTP